MNVRRKNLLSEKLSNRNRSRFRSMKQKKFHFATMKKKFRVQQFFVFLKQAAILNDKKQELKLLITVVAAN